MTFNWYFLIDNLVDTFNGAVYLVFILFLFFISLFSTYNFLDDLGYCFMLKKKGVHAMFSISSHWGRLQS